MARPRALLLRARRAFALPTVILVMLILVGALASGFGMLSSERGADDAAIQSQAAAALAETGLQQGLRNRPGLGLSAVPGASDSVRLTLTGGYADIVTTRLRAASGTTIAALYLVRSRGVATATGVGGAGNAVAISSAFATFQVMTMTVQSALTGINGIQKTGVSGDISGVDQCPVASGGTGTTLAAVAVPDVPGYSGSLTPLTGTPKVQSLGATAAAASTTVPFDWADIVSGNAITPDYLSDYLGNGFPTTAWFAANPSSWPTIIVNNGPSPNREFTLSSFGRGLLIVYGDLRLNGNSAGWDGIIITGGKIRSNGSNQVSGATITGLNVKLGYSVTATDVDELMGTKRYLYNSCNVGSALNSLGALRVYQNSWANTFPSY
jgi:hypothetical protein